jgi:hypothetical protein
VLWARVFTALGLVGACTVVDKGDYTFTDDPDDGEGGEGAMTGGKGGSSGSSNGGTSKGGASGSSGVSGDAGDGAGGTSTGGTSGSGNGGSGGAGDECDPNPCENGGECVVVTGGGTSCECADGYEGVTCADEIDECDPNPCKNGVACTDLVADFKCACPAEVTGKSCELARFEPIPGPLGVGQTRALSVCADGTVVLGEVMGMVGTASVARPFIWTVQGGSHPVPLPSAIRADVTVVPYAISGDGTYWVGEYHNASTNYPFTPIGGPTVPPMMVDADVLEQSTGGLPLPANGVSGTAVATTVDGTRSLGRYTDGMNVLHAIRWNELGMPLPLPNPFGQNVGSTSAGAVTRDGTIAAGMVNDGMGNLFVAFWAEAGVTPPGIVRTMTGVTELEVHAMSENARYTAGTYKDSATSNFPFITDGTRFIPITNTSMPVPPRGNAWDVSDDGGFIVGDLDGAMSGAPGPMAVIWKPDGTFRPLIDVLRDSRVMPAGWVLQSALGISADGTVIVGQALDPNGVPQGFIARL